MTKLRLGTSSYSYWHFTPEMMPLEQVLEAAAALGLAGVELLHRQMAPEEPGYLRSLRRRAFQLGLDLYNLSIHQDFVWAEEEERRREIEHTLHCIDLAHELGIPSIHINSGGFRKRAPFSELIAARGWIEPFLLDAGFTGYVSIEMEGHEPAETAMPKSVELLEAAWRQANEE